MISSQIPERLDDEVACGFLGVRLPHNFGARMFRPAIRRALPSRLGHLSASKRALATVATDQSSLNTPSSSSANEMESSTKPGALRPHLGIQVNQNHGLYAFFRKIKDEDSVLGYKYVTYEATNDRFDSASQSQLMTDEDRSS